nr:MAG TPA: hypothetical protein [Caudoviricetes sp.]
MVLPDFQLLPLYFIEHEFTDLSLSPFLIIPYPQTPLPLCK